MSLPIGFTDPVWLWLAVPAVAIVVVGWLGASRTLPIGRRVASLVIRLVLVACLVLSLAGVRLALPSDRLSVVFLLDASASMLDATREELVDWARDSVREMPEGDTAGVVVFGANALVDRLPSELDELARARVAAGGRGDRRRGRRAPGGRHLPGRHAAADRAAVGRQRHVGRGGGGDHRGRDRAASGSTS